MTTDNWLGVDLGGTKILAGAFNDEFGLLARSKLPTDAAGGPDVVFENVRKVVETVLEQASLKLDQVRGMGIGIPGQVDPIAPRVRFAPNLNWNDLDLLPRIPSLWSWPCYFENDVKVGTYGEFTHGAAKGAKNVLGIFVGTGVGGGLIINGEIYSGFNFSAGEIGHTIIHWRKGTELETIAGRHSMMVRAAELLEDAAKETRKEWKGVNPLEMKSSHLAAFVQRRDPVAVQLVDDAAKALGAAVGSAINLLNPEVIVIGGGVAGALGQPFLDRIWEIAIHYALPKAADGIRFVAAALKDDSGIYGAAAFARTKALQKQKT